jgi:outer membrane immunogenic protein
MRKFAFLFAALTFSGSAVAADMPVKASPPVVAPLYSWTGFYIGGNVGYSWGRTGETDTINDGGAITYVTSQSVKLDGIIGGGQLGVNWQTGNWVLGLEGDLQASGQKGSALFDPCIAASFTNGCDGVTLSKALSEKLEWLDTARGRIGYAFGEWLAYGTGGLAFGKVGYNSTTTAIAGGVGTAAISTSATRTGWVAGGGLEARITGNWTGKIEYIHVDLGTPFSPIAVTAVGFTQTTIFHSVTDDIVRVGVNYRFGWGG